MGREELESTDKYRWLRRDSGGGREGEFQEVLLKPSQEPGEGENLSRNVYWHHDQRSWLEFTQWLNFCREFRENDGVAAVGSGVARNFSGVAQKSAQKNFSTFYRKFSKKY